MKGYFIHNLPNEPTSGYDFAFVRSRYGVGIDPNLQTYLTTTRSLYKGLYQFPKETAENDAYVHSSQLVEDFQYYGDDNTKWAVLCGLYVNLTFISTWVSNLLGGLGSSTKVRPVIYTTYDHWNAICKGDNLITVVGNLLNKADLLISKFAVEAPVLPAYSSKLRFWEYELNKIKYEESGLSVATSLVAVTSDADSSSTGDATDDSEDNSGGTSGSDGSSSGGTSSDVFIHLKCPNCGEQIF